MTLLELTNYYGRLLAYEYRGRSRATAQMQLWTKQAAADYFAKELLTCFDLDTAVGTQLDVIGKYVGIDRNIGTPEDVSYFGLWTYASTLDPALYQGYWSYNDDPPLPAATGVAGHWYVVEVGGTSATPIAETWKSGDVIFSDGAVWAKDPDANGTGLITYQDARINAWSLFYSYILFFISNTALLDNDYRLVIRFQIIKNASDHTLASIMAAIAAVFPGQISLVDNKDMTMDYSVVYGFPLNPPLLKRFLPRPMAVGINLHFTPSGLLTCAHECRTKTAAITLFGIPAPDGKMYLSRTVTGSMLMRKLFTGTSCNQTYPGGGRQGGVVSAFYFTNQYYDVTVTIRLNNVTGSVASYSLIDATVAPAVGYPVYPVPSWSPQVDGLNRSIGYNFTKTIGVGFTVGVAIQAIFGFGVGAWNYEAGVFEYEDTWNIEDSVNPVTGVITRVLNITEREFFGDSTQVDSPIPGKQGDPLISGVADIANGRPDLFYTPWSTIFGFQMEPTYAAVVTAPTSRTTSGLGCVVGTGFGPTRMFANGSVIEAFTDEDTDAAAEARAELVTPWVGGCENPVFTQPHAPGDGYTFRVGEVRFVIGSYDSPLIFGQGYTATLPLGRRPIGGTGAFVPFDSITVAFIATTNIYFSPWFEIPREDGYEVAALDCTVALTTPYSMVTDGGSHFVTGTGDRIIGLS